MSSRDSETSTWARRGRRGEADRLAYAESARIDADTARREAELERLAAEAARKRADAMRVVAETTAMRLAAERDEAIAKASELEEELAAARHRLTEEPAAEPVPQLVQEPVQEPVEEPVEAPQETPDPEPAEAPVAAEPEPAAPERPRPSAPPPAPTGPELIRFASRGHRPVLTIVLALASLGAAAAAVYLAYRDELTSGRGLLAVAATVVLAIAVGRTGRGATTVTIEKGIVHVTSARTSERADLTSASTLVELIGEPGARGRKVMLVRKTRGPLTIDDSMVDLDAFVEALRHWRPSL
jgi:hypothetical protein